MAFRNPKPPNVGDQVYVDTVVYTSHGRDDFIGSLATVTSVQQTGGGYFITIEERPGCEYSWEGLAKYQPELKKKFGTQRAYEDPDYDSEFNTWD
jgi:hypothetical protein